MAGSINFSLADIYGTGYSTTEHTIPEAADQQALVDDQKAAGTVKDTVKKPAPVLLALALVFIIAIVAGGVK